MFEIAYMENGNLVRGGIKASKVRVDRWVRINSHKDPEHTYFAVEADENAISYEEWRKEVFGN